jgi:hypothetical protein
MLSFSTPLMILSELLILHFKCFILLFQMPYFFVKLFLLFRLALTESPLCQTVLELSFLFLDQLPISEMDGKEGILRLWKRKWISSSMSLNFGSLGAFRSCSRDLGVWCLTDGVGAKSWIPCHSWTCRQNSSKNRRLSLQHTK